MLQKTTPSNTPDPDALLWEALPELTLNIAQTAALCRVSVRQLGYWTRQGYVAAQGRGARRCYGLGAIRRVLAIRRWMDSGLSLRQALRQAGEPDAPPASAPARSAPPGPAADQMEALAHRLAQLFQAGYQVRDHAAGLSVKLGRSEAVVRVAAERLCEAGVLTKGVYQGVTVFQAAAPEAARA